MLLTCTYINNVKEVLSLDSYQNLFSFVFITTILICLTCYFIGNLIWITNYLKCWVISLHLVCVYYNASAEVRGHLVELVWSFHYVDSQSQSQVVKPGSKYLCFPRHLTDTSIFFIYLCCFVHLILKKKVFLEHCPSLNSIFCYWVEFHILWMLITLQMTNLQVFFPFCR